MQPRGVYVRVDAAVCDTAEEYLLTKFGVVVPSVLSLCGTGFTHNWCYLTLWQLRSDQVVIGWLRCPDNCVEVDMETFLSILGVGSTSNAA